MWVVNTCWNFGKPSIFVVVDDAGEGCLFISIMDAMILFDCICLSIPCSQVAINLV